MNIPLDYMKMPFISVYELGRDHIPLGWLADNEVPFRRFCYAWDMDYTFLKFDADEAEMQFQLRFPHVHMASVGSPLLMERP